MYRGNTIGVVVPAYNEAGFVGEVIETMPAYVDRVYVVDDCSTDETWTEIQRAAERINAEHEPVAVGKTDDASVPAMHEPIGDGGLTYDRKVVPIQHEENRGVGGAIKTGYQRARDDDLDIVAVMGGDGQMRPELLDRFLDPIVEDRADYTKGTRLVEEGHHDGMSSWRFVGNWLLTFLTKIASGYWELTDPQNGYTAISGEALETVDVDAMYEDYGYCNDLLVKLNAEGLRVADVPRPANYGDEESHITYHTYIPKVSTMLLANFCWRLRRKYVVRNFHPLSVLYVVGAGATAVGAAGLARAGVDAFAREDGPGSSALTHLQTVVLGCLSLAVAMIADREESDGECVRIDDQ